MSGRRGTRKRDYQKRAPKAKQKLIEGKYSHKFLTRLEPEVGKELERLKKELSIKTFNGVVVNLIKMYSSTRKSLERTEVELENTRHRMQNYQTAIVMYHEIHEELTKLGKTKDKGGRDGF